MVKSKVSKRGQVTIPKEIRSSSLIRSGTELEFRIESDRKITMTPTSHDIDDLKGIAYKKRRKAVSLKEIEHTIGKRKKNGIDTATLVRYLVQDDPEQSKLANQSITKSIRSNKHLWISQTTLCEAISILKRTYKLPKSQIVHIVQTLLNIDQISCESADIMGLALHDYQQNHSASFADCLIVRQKKQRELSYT